MVAGTPAATAGNRGLALGLLHPLAMVGTRTVLCVLVLSAGCADLLGFDSGVVIDDGVDCSDWTPQHFDACAIPEPAGALALTQAGVYTLDTTSGRLMDPGGRAVAGIATTTIDQLDGEPALLVSITDLSVAPGAVLRAEGARPLILAAWGTIDIAGDVDASSSRARAGAGALAARCDEGVQTGQFGNLFASGGGGGGFGGDGGRGGQAGLSSPILGGRGGVALPAAPSIVRAGCRGGASLLGTGIAVGGVGGGAVQLTARTRITIGPTARVHAGGAGGRGGEFGLGGGGGGSGGLIGLEAPFVNVRGTLAANGGGGGNSSGFLGASGGMDGQDGRPDGVLALGGAAHGGCTVPGGDGSGPTLRHGGDVLFATDCAGGGGGGGAGYVLIRASSFEAASTAVFSPTADVTAP